MSVRPAVESPATLSEAGRLCTQCGLCCDGTLFERARVLEDDDFSYSAAWGVIRMENGRRNFPLPCGFQQSKVCHIYSCRPKICGAFKCRLLARFENGKVSFAEAMQIIVQTVEHAARVRAALEAVTKEKDAPLLRLYFKLKESASLSPKNAPVFLEFAALRLRLNKHFRKKAEMHESSPAGQDAGMGNE